MANKKPTAASIYFTKAVDKSGKSRQMIADAAGLERPNIINMFKSGVTSIPPARIPGLSKALGVNMQEFFRIVMNESSPALLKALDEIYKHQAVNQSEMKLIEHVRYHTNGEQFKLTKDLKKAIDDAFVTAGKTPATS